MEIVIELGIFCGRRRFRPRMRVVNCGGVGKDDRQRWGWHGKGVSISGTSSLVSRSCLYSIGRG